MDDIKKLHNEFKKTNARFNTRRHFLKDCTLGLGGVALGSFLNSHALPKIFLLTIMLTEV